MTKKFTIQNLGCPSCAAKIEEKMNRMPDVEASINFTTRRSTRCSKQGLCTL